VSSPAIRKRSQRSGPGAARTISASTRDQRDNAVSHKIDPDVDLERDDVETTLIRTGLVTEFAYAMPDNVVGEATTATGGSFQSDDAARADARRASVAGRIS
jgi:hypothetical protein